MSDVLGESVPPDVHDVPELKLADESRATTTLGELNLESWMERDLSVALQGQTGLLLVAGPPASGRSTTVTTIVESLNNNARKIVTLDDHLAGNLNATAKLPEASLRDDSFPTMLHSVLGNEAGIVVVGELTNATTTSMAMRIARGGHLVISTIESRDAIGTILKLLEMNIEPPLIASSLQFVLAQRMARLLCPKCKRPRALSPWEMPLLADVCGGNAQLNDPVGCDECGNTGYNDKRAIFEMLAIGDGLRHTILRTPQPHEVHAAARACAYTSLIDTGYRLVAEGVTSMEEIEKVMAQGK